MILTCPSCTTRFNVKDEALLPAGRKVRCAKCGHSWFQVPPADAVPPPAASVPPPPEMAPPPKPEPEVVAEPAEKVRAPVPEMDIAAAAMPPPSRAARGAIYAGWAGLVLAIVLIAGSAMAFRQSIASAVPASAWLYAALGLPVKVEGLAFADVHYAHNSQNGRDVLAVRAVLVNASAYSLSVPPVRVVLSDTKGRVLYQRQFRAVPARLGPRQRAAFSADVISPPEGARQLTLELGGAL